MSPGTSSRTHALCYFAGVLIAVMAILFIVGAAAIAIISYSRKPDVTGPLRCTCVEIGPADAAPVDVVLTLEKP
jgi:hypothetical protein